MQKWLNTQISILTEIYIMGKEHLEQRTAAINKARLKKKPSKNNFKLGRLVE